MTFYYFLEVAGVTYSEILCYPVLANNLSSHKLSEKDSRTAGAPSQTLD